MMAGVLWYVGFGVTTLGLLRFCLEPDDPAPGDWYRRGEYLAAVAFVVVCWPFVLALLLMGGDW